MNVAASVRQMKDKEPHRFCQADTKCLWLVVHRDGRVTPCQKHVATSHVVTPTQERAS